MVNALNIILILYLDHTINCSTFTSMVVESSMTDPYGPLIAAGTSLKGVRHGGEVAAKIFYEIEKPENAKNNFKVVELDKIRNRGSQYEKCNFLVVGK